MILFLIMFHDLNPAGYSWYSFSPKLAIFCMALLVILLRLGPTTRFAFSPNHCFSKYFLPYLDHTLFFFQANRCPVAILALRNNSFVYSYLGSYVDFLLFVQNFSTMNSSSNNKHKIPKSNCTNKFRKIRFHTLSI